MPPSSTAVRKTVEAYLGRHPGERDALAELLGALDRPVDTTARTTLPEHVTCSAVVIDRQGRVLHIRHRATGGLILAPGGYIEPQDRTLLAAAVREVTEEAGRFSDRHRCPRHRRQPFQRGTGPPPLRRPLRLLPLRRGAADDRAAGRGGLRHSVAPAAGGHLADTAREAPRGGPGRPAGAGEHFRPDPRLYRPPHESPRHSFGPSPPLSRSY
ncbi:NUDIX domain-containing protein [Streptomyces diastaticus]|uniref:NUDIX domain-containing protein n=1 Tax=Streptomyces diastaticus TaxID=1956 RepID=UPI00344DAB61